MQREMNKRARNKGEINTVGARPNRSPEKGREIEIASHGPCPALAGARRWHEITWVLRWVSLGRR
jgi:hypothetical protein